MPNVDLRSLDDEQLHDLEIRFNKIGDYFSMLRTCNQVTKEIEAERVALTEKGITAGDHFDKLELDHTKMVLKRDDLEHGIRSRLSGDPLISLS